MRIVSTFFSVAFCLAAIVVMTQSTMAADLSLAEYRQHLQDLSTTLAPLENHPEQLHKIVADLPDHVVVAAGTGTYSLNYDWLRHDLKDFEQANAKRQATIIDNIKQHFHVLEDQCAAFENSRPGSGEDRQRLQEILARREFHRVHGPTAGEIFLQKILRWIDRLLNPTSKNGVSPIKVAIYVIVAVAVIMLVIWTKRRFDFSRQPAPPREIVPFAPSARGWRAWLADARQYAQQQDWRNSVHFAYWAAVSFLEEHGAWKPDRARTPREYLGFLTPMNSAYPTLEALTRRFEVIWYGHQDAHEKDFQDALGQLEKLGCK